MSDLYLAHASVGRRSEILVMKPYVVQPDAVYCSDLKWALETA